MSQADKSEGARIVHYIRPCRAVRTNIEGLELLCSKYYLAVTCVECLENRRVIISKSAKSRTVTPGVSIMLWVFLVTMPPLLVLGFFSEFADQILAEVVISLLSLTIVVGFLEPYLGKICKPLAARVLVKRFNEIP